MWTMLVVLGAACTADAPPPPVDAIADVPAARSGSIATPEGANLHYEILGRGTPLVFVHGGPGLDHAYLRPGLDGWGRFARIAYYDQRGTGRSDSPLDTLAVRWDAFVADIDRIREAMGEQRVVVAGHSFGGLLALDYALTRPERVRALILLNTAEPGARWATATAERARALRSAEDAAGMRELAASEGFAARDPDAMSRYYRLAFRGQFADPAALDALDLDLAERTARDGPDVGRLLGTTMPPLDRWARLGELDVPTLVVHGTADAPPVEMAEALADAFPRGRLVVLPTGHFPWVEDAPALDAAVESFLAALPPEVP